MTNLSRRSFLSLAPAVLNAQRRPRMNVLMIAVDDLRPELGCYGASHMRTPHLDKLASQGMLFTRAYCQQAVCSPSRVSLLTGRRPDTTRIYELQTHVRKTLPDVVTLPEHFKANGYQTTGISKIWHNGAFPAGGLDDAQSWTIPAWHAGGPDWGTPENADRQKRHTAALQAAGYVGEPPSARNRPGRRGPAWGMPDVADEELADGRAATQAIRALREMAGKPFFLAAGFLRPHLPFIAPKRYYDLYPRESIEPAPNPQPPRGVPPVALHPFGELRAYQGIPPKGPIPDEMARDLIRAYRASVSYMDAQVGRVLAELDRLKLRDNTVVVLWGDHGYHLGDHGLWNKHSNFEKATHVPLMVSAPGQPLRGKQTRGLSEFVDIYPSLCELCALPLPSGLEGSSFKPLLESPSRKWKKAAFSQYPRPVPGVGRAMGYSMRTDRYRFTEWTVPGKDFHAVELYDHGKDPHEDINLAAEPAQARLVAQLTETLHAGWKAALP